MKKLIVLPLLLLLQNCITVSINENEYRNLSIAEKEYIQPFQQVQFHEQSDNQDCFKLFEINTQNVDSLVQHQEYTWIHIWKPYCPNESCTNIAQYENFEKRHRSSGLKMIFTSSTYDMDDIIKYVQSARFSKPVYVLQSSYYGVKNKGIRRKFHKDLDKDYSEDDRIFYSDYLFVKDSLVYMGDEMNDTILERYISK